MSVIELCVEDVAGISIARDNGADRVELCRDLSCGGLTPTDQAVADGCTRAPTGGLHILVRPRPGNFVHSSDEIAAICHDIVRLKRLTENAPIPVGFVVGALNGDLTINERAARQMREAAEKRPLTFHRAFDQVPSIPHALDTLMALGFDRVLTTGGHPSTAQPDVLATMVRHCAEALIVLASGGLRADNVADIITQTNAREVHMRAPRGVGEALHAPSTTSAKVTREIVDAVRSLPKNPRFQ